MSLYSGTVDEQYVTYIMPPENGNKTEVSLRPFLTALSNPARLAREELHEVPGSFE